MNYRLLSLVVIVLCTSAKICSIYWIIAIFSSVLVSLLGITSVFLSFYPDKSLKISLRNPLEDQQIPRKLGLDSEYHEVLI